MIAQSSEIQTWLAQFEQIDKPVAISLLKQLQFIPESHYIEWLKGELELLPENSSYAVYAVRKFNEAQACLWDFNGEVINKHSNSHGSADLVCNIIGQATRAQVDKFLDHPSITLIRKKRVGTILLLDDSIGSGKRIAGFISKMLSNSSFKSWWNYGLLKIKILTYARSMESKDFIINEISKSNRPSRLKRLLNKIEFHSEIRYSTGAHETRWGYSHSKIYRLCASIKAIKPELRLGFGDTMSSIVFYHSVPNNLPGLLHENESQWKSLFPNRSFPLWLRNLIEDRSTQLISNPPIGPKKTYTPSNKELNTLLLIKKGFRQPAILASRLDVETYQIEELIQILLRLGLISQKTRLTKAGHDAINKSNPPSPRAYDRSLYLPKTWTLC